MKGRYVVRDKGELLEYNTFEDIPLVFDHLIAFEPEYTPGPHTHEQHLEMEKFQSLLQELLQRER